jgi:hypothetical protein
MARQIAVELPADPPRHRRLDSRIGQLLPGILVDQIGNDRVERGTAR